MLTLSQSFNFLLLLGDRALSHEHSMSMSNVWLHNNSREWPGKKHIYESFGMCISHGVHRRRLAVQRGSKFGPSRDKELLSCYSLQGRHYYYYYCPFSFHSPSRSMPEGSTLLCSQSNRRA
ncbi:hypothetical protein BDBG_16240 [Blastomyces gilchristii SLH14081]|uniref:Uncharacterized protein n=1 Tax=Blastomyces gilchristii (strain SLH14081) TaxID=559298 RepID=A0A179U9F2_BLAGS|nr:uncharacterized protein BDBG_16240 [Blastomyces gilchristii SLH14081]OAT04363.1 hypothetical protein BDBG_16240 [Blastomyces gilchristii SLH14081]